VLRDAIRLYDRERERLMEPPAPVVPARRRAPPRAEPKARRR
jgi:hypothetical protein